MDATAGPLAAPRAQVTLAFQSAEVSKKRARMTEPGPKDPAGPDESRARRIPDPWQIWMRRADQLELSHFRGPHLPVPAWRRKTKGERRWPVTLSVIGAVVLQFLLPARFTQPLPPWLLPTLEVALLIGLFVANPVRIEHLSPVVRAASIVLIALITIANAASAILLIRAILDGTAGGAAGPLFATGASIWGTNVIAFALWYWELDGGGPTGGSPITTSATISSSRNEDWTMR